MVIPGKREKRYPVRTANQGRHRPPRNGIKGRLHEEDKMLVKGYMTVNPITVQSDDSVWHALKMLRDHNIRHLPVIQGKRLVGMISDRDIRMVLPSSLAVPEEQDRFHTWGIQVKVGDVMIRKVVTVTAETETERAAQLMVEHRIGCLPVLRGSTLVGIITTIDMLRAMVGKVQSQKAPQATTSARQEKPLRGRPPRRGGPKKVRRT